MRQMAPACGVIVASKAGRDAGRSFVILKVVDDQYVLIADGELRKVQNPKRKQLRHLSIRPYVAQEIRQCLEQQKLLTDSDVRKALAAFEQADQKEEG